jgi:hypothetical protein
MQTGHLEEKKGQMQEELKGNIIINDRWYILIFQKRHSGSDKFHVTLL